MFSCAVYRFCLSFLGYERIQVPFFDTEILGVYGLRFFANSAHAPKANSATNPIDSRKLSIYGGKGGVGKTTSAASWGVRLTDAGMYINKSIYICINIYNKHLNE